MEKKNAKSLPERFYARHMNNGLAGYQEETILVNTDTMKKMCKSFDMKPVYVDHQDVNIDKLEEEMDGIVNRCFYNELDGWLWAEIVVTSDKGKEAVEKGLRVSNAYIPTEWGGGGTCHDIAYDREILNGDFTHLAIVPNPRYEKAVIMSPDEFKNYQDAKTIELNELKNSKTKKRNSKMKFWTKKEVENSDDILNASVTLIDGNDVTIKDMIKTIENAKKNEDDKNEKFNMDTEVTVDGKSMKLSEIISAYQEMNKKNETDEDDKKNESKDGDDDEKQNPGDHGKKNADDDEDGKKDDSDKETKNSKEDEDEKVKEDEKKNSKFFDELSNASAFGKVEKSKPALRADALKRGKERY